MISLADYLKNLTREGVYKDLLQIAADLGLTTTAWQPGEPPRGILGIFSDWIARTWNAVVLPVTKAFFLDYADGVLLTLVALALWGVRKKGATFANGTLTIENRTGLPFTFAPDDLVAKNADEKLFRNTTGGFLGAWSGSGDYPTIELDFEAVELGSDSTTPAGEIQTDPSSAPAGVFFQTNVAPFIGQDEEGDAELKERCRKSTGPLSPAGVRSAYEFVALSTRIPDGTEADRQTMIERLLVSREGDVAVNVNRVRVEASAGVVTVWLASPSGAAEGDTVTAGTDVYLVNQAIQILAVPLGITSTAAPAEEVTVTRTLQVKVLRDSNVTAEDVQAAVKQAVLDFFKVLPIGGHKLTPGGQGYVLMAELAGVAKPASVGIYHVTASSSTDVALATNEVALPAITVEVTLVTQS